MTDHPAEDVERVAKAIYETASIGPWEQGGLFYKDVARAQARAALDAMGLPSREQVIAWARKEFGVSNGTQTWVEFQGSAEHLADAILALLPAETPTSVNVGETPPVPSAVATTPRNDQDAVRAAGIEVTP